MKNKMSKLTKILYGAACFTACISTSGQIRIVKSTMNSSVQNSSAFIDASSFDEFNQSSNIGKGLLFPRTSLAGFTSFNGVVSANPNNFPRLFDGMIVYNVDNGGVAGAGATEGTLCRGFWYYDYPAASPTSPLNGGTWRPLATGCNIAGRITSLDCNDANIVRTGSLTAGVGASGPTFTMTYTGGNGGVYSAQTIPSKGVTGLIAVLVANNFANGTGTLTYTIIGTPSGTGTALFDINIGGQQCPNVPFPVGSPPTVTCGADIAPGVFQEFMCYNLGADTNLDPFTPAAGLHGDKYQWGMGTPALIQANDQANTGPVPGWNTAPAPDGSWSDTSKTANDPCPAGYRVPTIAQWKAVISNNIPTYIGTWAPNNYTSGFKFGSSLMLPATNNRNYNDGQRVQIGNRGDYLSTTIAGNQSYNLGVYLNSTGTSVSNRLWGMPIRCIKEASPTPGSITSLDCNNIGRTGTLTAGVAASGATFTMTYQGGDGGAYNAQSILSAGVAGLVAQLSGSSFANGTGTLTYTIIGTPSGAGTALFNINIGGQLCLDVPFTVGGTPTVTCGAFITPTEYKEFLCYNLGADTTIVDPLTPVAGLHGDKYQWGRKTPILLQADDQANTGSISGWFTLTAPNSAWLDASKTANDPCPAGYRVPTAAQWQGVLDNNQRTDIGTWTPGSYTAGTKFGSALMLPAAYNREYLAGAKTLSPVRGDYWSATSNSSTTSSLVFDPIGDSVTAMSNSNPVRAFGFSVRCIKE